jgi:hypothetical protein
MKKLIIILGMFLVSASALADHTTGLKQHQAGQNHFGSNIEVSGAAITLPKGALYLNRSSARQPNIVTDPVSCVEKWGDACLETDDSIETPQLDLGQTSIIEHLAPEPVIVAIPEDTTVEEPVDTTVEEPVSETIE